MDEWSKQKKAGSNGGLGMSKYVDYEEQKRLSRLRNVRGSINQSMQHNSWQTSQLEKRRKEQIRQRKMEAKKRAEKKGFQVDTGCVATSDYAFTKCGLKLKLSQSSSTPTAPVNSRVEVKREEADTTDKPASKPLVSQFARDSIELNRRKYAPAQKDLTKRKEQPSERMNVKKKDTDTKNKEDSDKSANLLPRAAANGAGIISSNSSSSSSSEGKENGDNQMQTLAEGKLLLQGKKTRRRKKSTDSYFMDFESLKREHADAIEMLKQLDEENKRLFVRSSSQEQEEQEEEEDRGGVAAEWTKEKEGDDIGNDDAVVDESLAVTLPEGMLHATYLSISLHDLEENDLQDNGDMGSTKQQLEGELDDEDGDNSEQYSSNSSRSKQEDSSDKEEDTDVEFT